MQLICATGNEQKFGVGQHIVASHGITLVQQPVDIDEIQGENPELIIRDKVAKAYAATGQPVVVTDDWWDIPALGGFPGAYMKSMNHWLTPDDFIRLMKGVTDRRIILHANLAYTDGTVTQLFSNDLPGTIVDAPRGQFGPTVMHIVALDYDEGRTISETYDQGLEHEVERLQNQDDAWHQLAVWLQQKGTAK